MSDLDQRKIKWQKRHDEYIQTRDRQRQKDAKLARLLGMPVVCLTGYIDPEGGYFCVNMADPLSYEVAKRNGEDLSGHIPFIILDEEKHQKLMDALIAKYYELKDDKLERKARRRANYVDIEDEEDDDSLEIPKPNLHNDDYFTDLSDVPWNPEINDTGIAHVVEFCTGNINDKKHWWKEIPHYSTDLNSVQDIEKTLSDEQIEIYIYHLTNMTCLAPAVALIKATAEQKTDALIALFEQELC